MYSKDYYKGFKKEELLELIASKDEAIEALRKEVAELKPQFEKSIAAVTELKATIAKRELIADDFYRAFFQELVIADAKAIAEEVAEKAIEEHLDSEYESSLGYDA